MPSRSKCREDSDEKAIIMKHTHLNATIEQMVQVAVIDTMSDPGTKAIEISETLVRLGKIRTIDRNIANILKLPTKIPYEEVTTFDEINRIFTMETHIQMTSTHRPPHKPRVYSLDVITEYSESTKGRVDVHSKLFCSGVPTNSIMHMGLTSYVKEQFRTGRHAENVALLAK